MGVDGPNTYLKFSNPDALLEPMTFSCTKLSEMGDVGVSETRTRFAVMS
jgi:hypothetical protein